jgi:hypothetical protein
VRQSIGAGGPGIEIWNVSSDSSYQNVAKLTGGLVDLTVIEALRLCDPTLVDEYIVAFETFWSDANQLVISLDPR